MDEMLHNQKRKMEEQNTNLLEQMQNQFAEMQAEDTLFDNQKMFNQEEQALNQYKTAKTIEENQNLNLPEKEGFRYKAARGRTISHVVVNKKITKDSEEMKAVKNSVASLEKVMLDEAKTLKNVATLDFVEKMEGAYSVAIMACQYYCDNKDPMFRVGIERKKNVENTLEELEEELNILSKAKEMIKEGKMKECKSIEEMYELANAEIEKQGEITEEEFTKSLKLADFINALDHKDNGFVCFFRGRFVTSSVKSAFSQSMARYRDETNTEIRAKFYMLIAQMLDKSKMSRELLFRVQYKLDLMEEQESKSQLPLTVGTIRDVWRLVTESSSVVEQTLKKGEEQASKTDYMLANTVHKMVGSTVDSSERLRANISSEKIMTAEIKAILHKAKKLGVSVPSLDLHQINYLVNGNIAFLRDEIFKNMKTVHRYMSNLNQGEPADINAIVNNEDIKTIIVAFSIKKSIATLDNKTCFRDVYNPVRDTSILADIQLKKALTKVAFELSGNQDLLKDSASIFVEGLSLEGSAHLEKAVQRRLPKEYNWQYDSVGFHESMGALKELCDNMKKLEDLQIKGLEEGLTTEEAKQLLELGAYLRILVLDTERMQKIESVSDKLVNTRFRDGVKAFKQINPEFFTSVTARIAHTLMKNENHAELQREEQKQKESVPTEEDKNVKAILSEQEKTIAKFSKEVQNVISILSLKKNTSDFLDPKNKHRESYKRLYSCLKGLREGHIDLTGMEINGVEIQLLKNRFGMLDVIVDNYVVSLPYSPELIGNRIESDMAKHMKLFSEFEMLGVLQNVNTESSKNPVHAREFYARILATKLEISVDDLANMSFDDLYYYTNELMTGERTKENIQKDVEDFLKERKEMSFVNTQEVLSLMEHVEKQKDEKNDRVVVQKKQEVEEKEEKWTEQEEAVKDLLADLIFFKDSWKFDKLDEDTNPGERIRMVLLENKKALAILLTDLTLIDSIFDKMAIPGDMSGMKTKIKDSLYNMLEGAGIIDKIKEAKQVAQKEAQEAMKKKMESSSFSWLSKFSKLDKRTDAQKAADEKKRKEEEDKKLREKPLSFLGPYMVEKCLENLLDPDKPDEFEILGEKISLDKQSVYEQLGSVNTMIQDAVTDAFNVFQDNLNISVDNLLSNNQEEEQQEEKKETGKKEGTLKLEKMLQKSASDGEKGQGAFTKIVLSNYFKDVEDMDKRSMLAAAFRYSKPIDRTALDKAELGDDYETIYLATKEREKKAAGALLGNILKGAGPLMQKMFQGMPDAMLPEALRPAIKDMKSKLAPIPEPIVKAEMQSIIDRSKGTIERVEVTRSLGAASVGQAFLCKLYGPNLPDEGKEVVVKLLRPDVRNRMMREKEKMLEYAKKADTTGGMYNTYQGQLKRIEEELNLTIEAQNVEKASIYDESLSTVSAMKLDKLVEPTQNLMVLEKAEGETADKYMESCREKVKRIKKRMEEIRRKNKDADPTMYGSTGGFTPQDAKEWIEAREELSALHKDMQKRQGYLADLAKVWVTEGIYENGFYHGDLHAGNIMLSDKGVTVIDFGNATTLTEEKQKHVIRMMFAAVYGDVDMYKESFQALLENTSPELYKEKEADLTAMLNDVLKTGSEEDTALRIIVSLTEAQNLGLEVPAAIFNFAQSQIRLQNTMESMQSIMKDIKDYSAEEEMTKPSWHALDSIGSIYMEEQYQYDHGESTHLQAIKKISDVDKEEFLKTFQHSRKNVTRTVKDGIDFVKEQFSEYKATFLTYEPVKLMREFSTLSVYLVNYLGNDAANKYFKRMGDCAKDIKRVKDAFPSSRDEIEKEVTENFNTVIEEICQQLDLKNDFVKNAKVQKTKDGFSKEDQEKLDEIYKLYNNQKMNSLYLDKNANVVGAMADHLNGKTYFDSENNIKAYAADREEYGEELLKAHNEFKEVWKQREQGNITDDYAEKYSNYLELLRKYSIDWFSRIEKTLPDNYKENSTSFLDVMGDVILSNKKKSLQKLGGWQAIKMGMRLLKS